MNYKKIFKNIIGYFRARYFGIEFSSPIYIGKDCALKGKRNINIASFVCIRPFVQLWAEDGEISIGKGTEIGERCRFSIANKLTIGEKVLFSPNCYITDCDHNYKNPQKPIMDQGINNTGQKVYIGDGAFIGINSVIIGNVYIGKNTVIGANSVVTKDIPDYCVAVGVPAKVVKVWNRELNSWNHTTEVIKDND